VFSTLAICVVTYVFTFFYFLICFSGIFIFEILHFFETEGIEVEFQQYPLGHMTTFIKDYLMNLQLRTNTLPTRHTALGGLTLCYASNF